MLFSSFLIDIMLFFFMFIIQKSWRKIESSLNLRVVVWVIVWVKNCSKINLLLKLEIFYFKICEENCEKQLKKENLCGLFLFEIVHVNI